MASHRTAAPSHDGLGDGGRRRHQRGRPPPGARSGSTLRQQCSKVLFFATPPPSRSARGNYNGISHRVLKGLCAGRLASNRFRRYTVMCLVGMRSGEQGSSHFIFFILFASGARWTASGGGGGAVVGQEAAPGQRRRCRRRAPAGGRRHRAASLCPEPDPGAGGRGGGKGPGRRRTAAGETQAVRNRWAVWNGGCLRSCWVFLMRELVVVNNFCTAFGT